MASPAGGGRTLLLARHVAASLFLPRGIWTLPSIARRPPLSLTQGPAWGPQQIRTKARGNEYQPSNIKRKHKHGWIKRIRTASGIEVILRRMLKGRKSLSH